MDLAARLMDVPWVARTRAIAAATCSGRSTGSVNAKRRSSRSPPDRRHSSAYTRRCSSRARSRSDGVRSRGFGSAGRLRATANLRYTERKFGVAQQLVSKRGDRTVDGLRVSARRERGVADGEAAPKILDKRLLPTLAHSLALLLRHRLTLLRLQLVPEVPGTGPPSGESDPSQGLPKRRCWTFQHLLVSDRIATNNKSVRVRSRALSCYCCCPEIERTQVVAPQRASATCRGAVRRSAAAGGTTRRRVRIASPGGTSRWWRAGCGTVNCADGGGGENGRGSRGAPATARIVGFDVRRGGGRLARGAQWMAPVTVTAGAPRVAREDARGCAISVGCKVGELLQSAIGALA